MKAEHLNSFIQGAQNILSTISGEKTTLGQLFLKQPPPYKSEEITIIIGIVGDLQGNVLFTMNNQTAHFLAGKLMVGMTSDVIAQMWQSAVSEIMNMVSGSVATIFFGNGTTIDITTPTFVVGEQQEAFSFIQKGSKLVCMPLSFPDGQIFEIDVLLS